MVLNKMCPNWANNFLEFLVWSILKALYHHFTLGLLIGFKILSKVAENICIICFAELGWVFWVELRLDDLSWVGLVCYLSKLICIFSVV